MLNNVFSFAVVFLSLKELELHLGSRLVSLQLSNEIITNRKLDAGFAVFAFQV